MSAPATRRVRKLWLATRENGRLLSFSTSKANNDYLDPFPVYVLDASPAAMEAHVEAVASVFLSYFCPEGSDSEEQQQVRDAARSALAALMKGRTVSPRRA